MTAPYRVQIEPWNLTQFLTKDREFGTMSDAKSAALSDYMHGKPRSVAIINQEGERVWWHVNPATYPEFEDEDDAADYDAAMDDESARLWPS